MQDVDEQEGVWAFAVRPGQAAREFLIATRIQPQSRCRPGEWLQEHRGTRHEEDPEEGVQCDARGHVDHSRRVRQPDGERIAAQNRRAEQEAGRQERELQRNVAVGKPQDRVGQLREVQPVEGEEEERNRHGGVQQPSRSSAPEQGEREAEDDSTGASVRDRSQQKCPG